MKKLFKYDYILITIICAIIIICTIYKLQDVAPFGDNSLLTIDFFHQYGPMLGEFYDRIHSGLSLVYSFNMGMGLPFFRNFFNYMSSPFNIIILLFKRTDLLMSYSVVIGLKAVASAVTMVFYLRKKFEKNYMFIVLSLLYAFSAYFTAYYWNIMWIDGMIMLPLVSLGIERLVNENKILLYIITLAVMLFANYFIGYMLCIFSVLYFIVYLFIKSNKLDFKKILKKIGYFAISSLIAGGLCAIFLIPMYFALKGISATNDVWPTSQYYDFTLKEFIFNHFSGVGSTVLKSGITCAPNVSCGVVSIALLIIFLINPKIDFKIKYGYIFLFGFLVLSFLVAPLDFIWHAFHVPNDLPYRYSFIYSFILIIISAYGIRSIKEVKPLYIGILYIFMLCFITLMKVFNFENITNEMLIVNYVVITIFYLCYIIYIYFNKWKRYAVIFAIITSMLECIMVVNNNWYIDQYIDGFYDDYAETKEALKYVSDTDKEMHRIERINMLTFNDPSWYGYYGEVAFSSMEYENMAAMQHKLGMPGNEINSFYYKQNTPIYDLMFNIGYLLGKDLDNDRYSLFYSGNNINVYRNNYNGGLMYGINSDIKEWDNNFNSAFKNQNDYVSKATGITNVLEKLENIKKDVVYTDDINTIVKYKTSNNHNNFYMYFDEYNIDFVVVDDTLYYFNDNYDYVRNYNKIEVFNYVSYNERFVINKKTQGDDIVVYVGYNNYYNDDFSIYELNENKFEEVYRYLEENKVTISSFRENYIKANINANKNMTIFTSIPYDDGWKVYIDGKYQDTYSIANALLGFDVTEGTHEIELKYEIPYIKIGILISFGSMVGLLVLLIFKKD